MKGNSKKCRNLRFEPPFGELRCNAQGSSMAQWKAHCRLPIGGNLTFFFASCHGRDTGTIKRNLSKSEFWRGGVTLSANCLWTVRQRINDVAITLPLDVFTQRNYQRRNWAMSNFCGIYLAVYQNFFLKNVLYSTDSQRGMSRARSATVDCMVGLGRRP